MMYVATTITVIGLMYGVTSLRNRDKYVGTFAFALIMAGLGTIFVTYLALTAINNPL